MNEENFVEVVTKYYPDRIEVYANGILIEDREREGGDPLFFRIINLEDFEDKFGY